MEKQLKFFLNDTEQLDVSPKEQLKFFLSFAVADVNNLESIKNGVSKTITFPGSANNRKILGFSELPSAGNALDQTVKKTIRAEYDGTDIVNGFLKMVEPIWDSKHNIAEYKAVIISDNGDWKQDAKLRNLNELDYSDQDHVYSKANIETSETVDAARDYVYPLINYGHPTSDVGSVANQTHDVAVEDRYLAFNAFSLLERIFNALGYKVSSTFLNAAFFKALYIPFTRERMKHAESFKTNKLYRAGLSADFVQASQTNVTEYTIRIPFDVDSGTDLFDTGSLYDTGNFEYVVAEDSEINFFVEVNMQWGLTFGQFGKLRVRNANDNDKIIKEIDVVHPGTQANPYGGQTLIKLETGWNKFTVGDKLFAELFIYSVNISINPFTIRQGRITPTPFAFTRFYNDVTVNVIEGNTVEMNRNLPDINQLEYIENIKRMFNLYFYTDISSRTVFIEPRDQFYNTTPVDISDLVDKNKPIRTNFLGDKLNKTIRYRYTSDSEDKFVEELELDQEIILASHDEDILNKFSQKGTTELQTGFHPTVMDDWRAIGLKTAQVPKLWKEDLPADQAAPWETSFGLRILFYDGLVTLPEGETWTFNDGTPRNTYPYFYSVDEVTQNDNSLYFNDTAKSIGLWSKHYKNLHNVIDNGRLRTIFMNLTEAFINKLDPRDSYHIEINGEGTDYVINKIIRYSPLAPGSSEVEFLTFLDIAPDPEPGRSPDFIVKKEPPLTKAPKQFKNRIIQDSGGNLYNKGTGNDPKLQSNSMMLGQGLTPQKDEQVLIGNYPRNDPTHKLIMGTGRGADPRGVESSVVVDKDGKLLSMEGLAGLTLLPALDLIDSNFVPPTEIDGDIYLLDASGTSFAVDSILHISESFIRIISVGSDFTLYLPGDTVEVVGATNAVNNGRFRLTTVVTGSHIEFHNPDRTDPSDDEGTSPATMTITNTAYDGAGQNDWIRYYSIDDTWRFIQTEKGFRCFNKAKNRMWEMDGSLWTEPTRLIPLPTGYRRDTLLKRNATITAVQIGSALIDTMRDFADELNVILTSAIVIDIFTDIDTGAAPAADTWYYVYVVADKTETNPLIGLFSLAKPPTGPALPAGYTNYVFVGVIRTDQNASPTTTIRKFHEIGNGNERRYEWDADNTFFQALTNGNATAFAPIALGNFLPDEAQLALLFSEFTPDTNGNKLFIRHGSSPVDPLNIRQYVGLKAGAELTYTEKKETFNQASGAGTWLNKDLSGAPFNVPGLAICEFVIANTQANAQHVAGVRANGSSIVRNFDIHEAEAGGEDFISMHVITDASSIIETFTDSLAQIEFTLVGYWSAPDAGDFENVFETDILLVDPTIEYKVSNGSDAANIFVRGFVIYL